MNALWKTFFRKRVFGLCGGLAWMVLAGCTVGPDHVPPETSTSPAWHSDLKGGLTPGPLDPNTLAAWWTTLNDPQLSGLIERAVAGNLDLKTAQSRIRESRARRGIAEGAGLPTLTATASATSSRTDTNRGIDTRGESYSSRFDAGWELDLFGRVRRSVEAAQADLEANEENLHDVLVSLLAETALNYIEVRTFQARLAAAEANLESQNQTYQLTLWRAESGLDDEVAMHQAKYNLESTRAQIPTLRTGLEEALNRLAVLVGETPGNLHKELEKSEAIPVPPAEVAVGVPADIIRQRPDIRRAERELAAQTARVGVAMADLYPRLTLNGSIGVESLSRREPSSSSRTGSISGGPQVSWAIFDPTVRPNIEIQSALQEQAMIQYQAVVLSSFEEVENALVAYAQERQRRESLRLAMESAQVAADLEQFKYQAGLSDFINVLVAQRSLLTFQDQYHQSNGTVTSDVIRLYKSLGGGWTSMAAPSAMSGSVEQNRDRETKP
jgi:outer membrane protein, multidrug efflux system